VSRQISFEVPSIKFYENYPVGAALIHADRKMNTISLEESVFMAI